MERVTELRAPGGVKGDGTVFAIENHAEPALASLRYKLKDADMQAAEEAFEAAGKKFAAGTIAGEGRGSRATGSQRRKSWDCRRLALAAAPSVKTHSLRAARILLLHTWLSTQTEGWWRLTLDKLQIPYDYASTQTIAKSARSARKIRCDFVSAGRLGRLAE